MARTFDRRELLGAATGISTFLIVPRHVLGQGFVAPSDQVALGYLGCGTQGLREMMSLLPHPDIRVVAVCDPNKDSNDYRDWGPGLGNQIGQFLQNTSWREGRTGIPGGRDVGREVVEGYYAKNRTSGSYKGCTAYADFRELLDKEKDLNGVKIMTPDHLHATIAIAAMKKGKHVMLHKPLANRMNEVKLAIETARQTKVATHFIPWENNGTMEYIMNWIKDDQIGTLREVHNWSNRPVWPQYTGLPTETPPVPAGFDWDLWLGPEKHRPYHPNYTHMTFRGWYDFGAGSVADMGHYSLWAVFKALEWGPPISAEPMASGFLTMRDLQPVRPRNDYAFPMACILRFKFAPSGNRPAVDLFWYDGGMRPPTPPELEEDNREMPAEGMMFVGDKGKIMSGFMLAGQRIIPEKKWLAYSGPKPPADTPAGGGRRGAGGRGGAAGRGGMGSGLFSSGIGGASSPAQGLAEWIAAVRGGPQTPSSFLLAGPISEMVNLGAVALRAGTKVVYDSAGMKITNVPEANKYLTRDYRKGWEL